MKTYEDLIKNLNEGVNFSFAKLGDGEANCILGASKGQGAKQNTDGHKYFPDLGKRLRDVLESKPDYIYGFQNLMLNLRKDDKEFHELVKDIDYCDADILHKASIKGNLQPLFDALKTRDILFVGNIHMFDSFKYFEGEGKRMCHIVIPEVDAWLKYKNVLANIKNFITDDVVILYCASMMTEVLIDDIYNEYGNKVTQIDIGSLFDPYCGRKTRSYHHKLKL